MNIPSEPFELLKQRIDSLEKRVERLEQGEELVAEVHETPTPIQALVENSPDAGALSGIFGTIGTAMLGIAGAYLLRALASSDTSPRRVIAGVAIIYAIAWLAFAVRASRTRPLAGTIYTATSAIILAPMLWELTLRFQTLQPTSAAVVLAIFVISAFFMTWKSVDSPVLWVSSLATAGVALTLQIATHNNLAYIGILMMTLVLCDLKSGLRHGLKFRPIIALATDTALWIFLVIYSNPETVQQDYVRLGTLSLVIPAVLLFVLDATRLFGKSVLLGEKLGILDTIQAIISFLLMWANLSFFTHQIGLVSLGIASIVMAFGCYALLLAKFLHDQDERNYGIFAMWSAGLLLAGVLTTMPLAVGGPCLGACAVIATALGVRLKSLTLELQGVLYLTVAVIVSRSLQFGTGVLTGDMAPRTTWDIWLITVCAVLAYVAGRERLGEAWKSQIMHLITAWWAAFCVAALLGRGLLGITALFVVPLNFHIALVRTLAICLMAVALAYMGARGRLEMKRIAYAALALVAIKLVFEDLRHGRMEFVAASFFVFAITLIAVPQLARKGRSIQH